MRVITQSLSFTFFLLFVLLTPVVVAAYSVAPWLQADAWKAVLAEQGVYETLPQLAGQQVAFTLRQDPCLVDPTCTLPAILEGMDGADYAYVVTELAPADWIAAEVNRLIDQLFAALEAGAPTLLPIVDTTPLQTQLDGAAGERVLTRILETLPPCGEAPLINLLELDLPQLAATLACQPPAELMPLIVLLLQEVVVANVPLPDRLPLAEIPLAFRLVLTDRLDFDWQQIQAALSLAPLLPLLLLGGIMLLNLTAPLRGLRWSGGALLFSALNLGILLLIGWQLSDRYLTETLALQLGTAMTPALLDTLSQILVAARDAVLRHMLGIGGGLFLAGVGVYWMGARGTRDR